MGTTALRQLLKSLCSNSAWNYAVLWKLRHENPVILSWEDGYFNYPTTRKLEEIVSDDDYCQKDTSYMISPDFETHISSANSEDYSVGLLVAEMSCLQYALGEGGVGKVASTRHHSWVSLNDILTGVVECPDEWLLQFASGIKTILLIPVLPHGVLQLGSLEQVSEDINIVESVQSKLTCLHSVQGNIMPLSLKEESEAQLSSSLESYPIENSDTQLSIVHTSVKTENSEQLEPVSAFELDSDYPSITYQDTMLLNFQDACIPAFNNLPEAFNYGAENMVDVPCRESKLLDMSTLMEELDAYSDCYDYSGGFCGESFNRIMNFYPIDGLAGETSTREADIDISINSCHRLTEESEHKAPQPTTEKQSNEILWDSTSLVEDAPNTNRNPIDRTELSWFAKGPDAGYLLEDVVAKANTSIDNSYGISKNFVSYNSFSGCFTASLKPRKRSYSSSPPSDDDSIPWSHLTSTSTTDVRISNSTTDALKSMMNILLSKEQQSGDSDDMKTLKGRKTQNSSKRRAKASDNQKARPRDRQLIQDRVKELRELVPNGTKCSIDSLLDRTVNHMVYLRSVADQANKLRQCAPQKLDGSGNGTTRAIEFGNEFRQCPILVEDLDYPGCMLIEVLCNDDGLFLEIADVIHGLQLTILKGVQESRSGDTWARYIVEVSKGFHRLDIFWPLVQLLQRKRRPISSRI